MNTDVMWSSRTDNWATPQEFFDELNAEFGFNLDPCASEENHKCEKFFTKEQDGLVQDWGGPEFFATHHTARPSATGSGRHTKKGTKRTPWSSCSSQREQTRGTSTTTYSTEPRCGSCVVA